MSERKLKNRLAEALADFNNKNVGEGELTVYRLSQLGVFSVTKGYKMLRDPFEGCGHTIIERICNVLDISPGELLYMSEPGVEGE